MADSGYIGSKLSLISKSDIRYVGTLQNVDTQTSSIALGQVQSFGTEGRRGGRFQDEIPPSGSVFEYIVFRGADVKDLQVFEAPPPGPPSYAYPQYATPHAYPYTYFMPTPYYAHPMTNQCYSMYPPPLPLDAPLSPPPSMTTMSTMTQKPEANNDVTPNITFSPTVLVPDSVTKVRTPLVDDDNSHLTISKPDTKDSPSSSPRTTPDTLVTTSITELDGVTRLIDDLDIGRSSRNGTTTESDLKTTNNNSVITANTNKSNSGGGGRNNKRKSKSRMTNTAKHPTTLQPHQQEFDFASSNAKFNKDTNQTLANPSVDAFYDKKKSFFDNISCDAKEKTEHKDYRKKHKDEKQLNLETFGPSSILLPRRKQTRQGGRTNSIKRNNGKPVATIW